MSTLAFIFGFLVLLYSSLAHAACPAFNTNATLPNSQYPPDPFTFLSGAKVSSKADWQCRRTELAALLQDIELGSLPPKPAVVNATFDGRRLTVTVGENNMYSSFGVTINLPSNRSIADGPFPAIIAYGASSVPLNGTGIATIIYNNDQIASQTSQSTRGSGIFYTVYGSSHSAGALIAWAWGISRVLDALELLGPETTGIDPKHVGLTGCSRNGKGVLVAGAFEPRIALTITQEAGVGGPACWRLYNLRCKTQRCIGIPEPTDPFDSPWYRRDFPRNIAQNFAGMPFDQHELIALHAPRGLLVLENNIDWLEPVASTVCGKAGGEVYKALGVGEAYGFSLSASHNHCQFPSKQQVVLDEYLGRYLLGKGESGTGEGVFESEAGTEAERYVHWGWSTPALE
ncbi:carbohydrate esterase family 15 protein [Trematosphaeria pertusa]|uniref:(4-O-methyl)-D-glucuronate--lignin esterase n=1 Tax=Trematosphaeria pertusa TaxID=390896 RepID=A0A6A6J1F1_9PLEO|nr:carbohydrate esterase family 15 protein [Trematosphaeria pertusa]KAF2256012.1 carbohydrate esterase family 15 protein [Trematosphaeria pertusa]